MKEIQIKEPTVVCKTGSIDFKDYEELKNQVTELAENIKNIVVNEENIKQSKKLLAQVNKSVKKLNDERISIKKQLAEPYEEFNSQIKEIENIVKNADNFVRSQVRELEERERDAKKEELKLIWHKRIKAYNYAKIVDFEDWITNKHLNKSMSTNKCEEDMTDYLEKIENDVKTLSNMEHSDELIIEYKNCQDVAVSIQRMNDKYKQIKKHKEILSNEVNHKEYYFIINSEKDARFVELLLKENNIDYKVN